MSISARNFLAIATLLSITLPLGAQTQSAEDRPTLFVPLRPLTRQQLDQREALKQYVLGLLSEREDRLLEAMRAYEESVKLDPTAVAVLKALIPIYLAVDRGTDALTTTRKVLDQASGDYETWYIYARQLRDQGQAKEALVALQRGLACRGVKDYPDLCQQMHYDCGVLQEQAKAHEKAAVAFTAAVQSLEHHDGLLPVGPFQREEVVLRIAETYERVGRNYLKARKYDQAVSAFRQAQAKYPDGAGRLNLNLAQVCNEQGKPGAALDYLDGYLRLQPQGIEAYDLKITLLQRLNRDAEVVPWLEKASATDRHNVSLTMLLARQYARTRQPAQAERLYRELAEQTPSAEVYRGLFGLYRDAGGSGLGKALDLLNKTLATAKDKQKPADSPAPAQARAMLAALREDGPLSKDLLRAAIPRLEADVNLQPETLHVLAALADRNRQLDEAERFYRESLKNVKPNVEALVYGGLLRVLWKARKYDDIIKVCRAGLRDAQATNHVLFHSDLSRALARNDKIADALAEADEAVRLAGDADRMNLRNLRVRILVMAKRYAKAEEECQAMLKEAVEPGDKLEVRYLMSSLYSSSNEPAKAEEQLEFILKLDSTNATACNDLGYLWADRGKNLAEAERLIRKALELDRQNRKARAAAGDADEEDNAAYIDSLGWVLFRKGDVEAARKELERASVMPDGDDPVIWDHLGDVYQRLGQTTQAQEAWRRALGLYEQERRRDRDDRYRDLQRKIRLLQTSVQQPR